MQGEEFDFKLGEVSLMVKKSIVVGHVISSVGIEVDKPKINLIANVPVPPM